jgi:integrase
VRHGTKAARSGGAKTYLNSCYTTASVNTSAFEILRLIEATQDSRNEARDHCLFRLMFRHRLCTSEACRLRLDQVDTNSRVFPKLSLIRQVSRTNSVISKAILWVIR